MSKKMIVISVAVVIVILVAVLYILNKDTKKGAEDMSISFTDEIGEPSGGMDASDTGIQEEPDIDESKDEETNTDVEPSEAGESDTDEPVDDEVDYNSSNSSNMADEYEASTVSDKYKYISDNYEIEHSDATYDTYKFVRNMTLSEEEFCNEEAFSEFLSAIEFDSGSLIRFMDSGDGVYMADYENCSMSYSYRANMITLIKNPVQYS